MAQYPTSPFERKVDAAIAKRNRDYLAALEEAGEGACPNCLKQGGGWCWCCTDDQHPRRDHKS